MTSSSILVGRECNIETICPNIKRFNINHCLHYLITKGNIWETHTQSLCLLLCQACHQSLRITAASMIYFTPTNNSWISFTVVKVEQCRVFIKPYLHNDHNNFILLSKLHTKWITKVTFMSSNVFKFASM